MKAKLTNAYLAQLKAKKQPYEVNDTELKGLLLRVQPTGVQAFYFRYRPATGKQNRVKLGPGSIGPTMARDLVKQHLAAVLQGNDPQDARRARRAPGIPTLRAYLAEEYEPEVLATHKSGAATMARLRHCFAEFLDWPLSDINMRAIEKWRGQRLNAGNKPSTLNRVIGALRAALLKAVNRDILEMHPLAKVKALKEDRAAKVRFLSDDEEDHLMAALDTREERIRAERDSYNSWCRERKYPERPDLRKAAFADHLKPMVVVSLHTGMRRGELFTVQWEDVSLDRAMLTVRGHTAKSGATRHIPLSETALSTLREWKKQTTGLGLVFAGKSGARFDNANTSWEAVLQEAKIDSFRWHDMRHTFASWLVMAGENLNTVRELLGHGDIKMTLRYSHLAPEVKAAAVKLLDHRRKRGDNVLVFTKGKRKE